MCYSPVNDRSSRIQPNPGSRASGVSQDNARDPIPGTDPVGNPAAPNKPNWALSYRSRHWIRKAHRQGLPFGLGAATRGCQTNPISPFSRLKMRVAIENEANLWAGSSPLGISDCRLEIRGGRAVGRRGAKCQTNPISRFLTLPIGVAIENEADLWAGNSALGISDCRLEIRGGRAVGRQGAKCQTNPISPLLTLPIGVAMENEANLWAGNSALGISDCRLEIRGGRAVECRGAKCQTNPISRFLTLPIGVAMQNEPNLWAGNSPLGISDCPLGIRGGGAVERRGAKCQTNPISPFSRLKMRVAIENEANLWAGSPALGISDCRLEIRGGRAVGRQGAKCQTKPICGGAGGDGFWACVAGVCRAEYAPARGGRADRFGVDDWAGQ